eukprot:Blabericola_migrator_1__4346@NODE_2339_length_2914_cov_65_114155_g682_i2_p4_GENE_NODE_2339_length_2914_cov_65_114155_g682_i2NODE_2339_length_2914_cov_65_114155_g682_i2_p4_ORF_typecomplete_len114_score8_52Peptidase_M10_C/PF08548_11/0_042_NODE_2339_length_2914_cov_65_114155_g682_i2463804
MRVFVLYLFWTNAETISLKATGNVLIPVGGSTIDTTGHSTNPQATSGADRADAAVGTRVAQSLENIVDGSTASGLTGMLSANSLAQQAGADRRKTANLEVEEVLKEKADGKYI